MNLAVIHFVNIFILLYFVAHLSLFFLEIFSSLQDQLRFVLPFHITWQLLAEQGKEVKEEEKCRHLAIVAGLCIELQCYLFLSAK